MDEVHVYRQLLDTKHTMQVIKNKVINSNKIVERELVCSYDT